jgi:hypothetical protein
MIIVAEMSICELLITSKVLKHKKTTRFQLEAKNEGRLSRKRRSKENFGSKTLLKAKNESANIYSGSFSPVVLCQHTFYYIQVAIMYGTGNIFDHYFWGDSSAHEGRIINKYKVQIWCTIWQITNIVYRVIHVARSLEAF